jgi:hypothetical protein
VQLEEKDVGVEGRGLQGERRRGPSLAELLEEEAQRGTEILGCEGRRAKEERVEPLEGEILVDRLAG